MVGMLQMNLFFPVFERSRQKIKKAKHTEISRNFLSEIFSECDVCVCFSLQFHCSKQIYLNGTIPRKINVYRDSSTEAAHKTIPQNIWLPYNWWKWTPKTLELKTKGKTYALLLSYYVAKQRKRRRGNVIKVKMIIWMEQGLNSWKMEFENWMSAFEL